MKTLGQQIKIDNVDSELNLMILEIKQTSKLCQDHPDYASTAILQLEKYINEKLKEIKAFLN